MSRNTVAVNKIFSFLTEGKKAVSAVDLVAKFTETINKATVYRVLARLEESGRVHSFLGKEGVKYYAACHGCSHEKHIDNHPHLQCRVCGKTSCLLVDIDYPQTNQFKVETAQLLLIGLCKQCVSNGELKAES